MLLRREGRKRRARRRTEPTLAVVQVPSVLSRFVPLPAPPRAGAPTSCWRTSSPCSLGELFPGFTVEQTAAFRVTRNWDLNLDEEESEDLLSTIQEELRRRDRGAAVRLELDAAAPPLALEASLRQSLKLAPRGRLPHPRPRCSSRT